VVIERMQKEKEGKGRKRWDPLPKLPEINFWLRLRKRQQSGTTSGRWYRFQRPVPTGRGRCRWSSYTRPPIGDTLRLLGAIEIHRNRAVYVSLNTNANPTLNPNTNPNHNPNLK